MRISKRQLRKIIKESLSLQNEERRKGIPKALNFRKIRKDLFKLKADIDNQELLDIIGQHRDDLRDKVKAGESKFMKGRYREAVTLLKSLDDFMNAPSAVKIEKAVKLAVHLEEPDVDVDNDVADDDEDPWYPDPKPGSEWEYQLRNCVWYARKKGTNGNGVKLGPAKATSGKYKKSIAILDKEYESEIKACKVQKKPTPKPKPKPKPTTETSERPLFDLYVEVRNFINDSNLNQKFDKWADGMGETAGDNPSFDLLVALGYYKDAENNKNAKEVGDGRLMLLDLLDANTKDTETGRDLRGKGQGLHSDYSFLAHNGKGGEDHGQEEYAFIFNDAMTQLQEIMLTYIKSSESWKQNIGKSGASNRFVEDSYNLNESIIKKTRRSRSSIYRNRRRR